MDNNELPTWILSIRDNYRTNPVRWMWGGMTLLVVLLLALLLVPRYFSYKSEATELLSQGLASLAQGDNVMAMQSFEKLDKSYSLSGQSRDALFYTGAALFGLERYDAAEKAFRQYREKRPRGEMAAQAILGEAACREMQGDQPGALALYREARSKYGASFMKKDIEVQLARLSLATGDTPTAAGIYQELAGDSEGLWRDVARGRSRLFAAEAGDTAAR